MMKQQTKKAIPRDDTAFGRHLAWDSRTNSALKICTLLSGKVGLLIRNRRTVRDNCISSEYERLTFDVISLLARSINGEPLDYLTTPIRRHRNFFPPKNNKHPKSMGQGLLPRRPTHKVGKVWGLTVDAQTSE